METMTKKEVAGLFKVSERTVERWMSRKVDPMPKIKVGDEMHCILRFDKDDVVKWFKNQ